MRRLSDVVPATVAGAPPHTVVAAGLQTNPVHVLDMAIVLPAMILAGVLLLWNRPYGYVLGPPLLAFGIVMGIAIEVIFAALALRNQPVTLPPAVLMAIVIALEAWALAKLLRGMEADTSLDELLRVDRS